MEQTGVPGRIQVSDATHALLPNEKWEAREGGVQVKGKVSLSQTIRIMHHVMHHACV